MPLLQVKDVSIGYGDRVVLDRVELHVEAGERLCVLGRNGEGKTTLLRAVAGEVEVDDGEVLGPPRERVAYLPQHVPPMHAESVYDVVSGGLGAPKGVEHGADVRRRVETAVSRVGLEVDADASSLSAGLARRALLARALVTEPELLLLDEPTNHLDVASIVWLEELLRRRRATLLFVTHDRAFLRRLATGILELDRGSLTRWPADYDRYRERKQADLEVEARANALFDKRHAAEEGWIREGVRERRKRNQGRVRRLQALRSERAGRRERSGVMRLEAHKGERTGRLVLQARDVSFAYDEKPVVRGLTTTILRGDRVGVVGRNGTGKTTLLRLLVGDLEPGEGSVRRGTNLQVAYFDQLHRQLDDDATAADNVGGGAPTVTVNGKSRHVIGYLRNFLFTADQARSSIRTFSGGERNRLLLARLFAKPSNVLVLDEPTNDLDVETLEVLEDLLVDYEGTILLVSHDRELLDHVVTSTFVLRGDGTVGEHVGGFSDLPTLDDVVPAASKPKPKARPARPTRKASLLSREEKKELHDLPATIERLETEQATLHEQMADPEFFKQDGAKIAEAQARLAALERTLEATYERWETLEAKKDA